MSFLSVSGLKAGLCRVSLLSGVYGAIPLGNWPNNFGE
ncbi:hypothetical protein L910_4637 [Vibrio fluvialis PG41]|uniref:Uncharacterized protein n=1 Tax=Vibrio fluvialis PG41 TaxID=1336752 RepID=S7JLB8_VIBFL|nr:hypothetical protein L910_4637 [Vibrio fluvialis PG41]